jgi:nucleoid-associated protein EbfC
VQGSAGGGLVKVTVDGQGELTDVVIAKEAIEPGDQEETAQTLADLILAACRDAYRALSDVQEDMMGPLAGGLVDSLGAAAGAGGLPGLPGWPGKPPLPGIGLEGQPGQPGQADTPGTSDGED